MCGIAGFDWSDNKLITKMTDCLVHRGPDAGAVFVDEHVSLGHRRLSIVDLSKRGAQPMKYKHLTIVFNGEIYNFKKLRSQLIKKGYRFKSTSDTEVILKGFECWGEKLPQKLNGQFAFVVYDAKKKKLFLCRDRFGIKPLFYIFQANEFAFASEIKALRQNPWYLNYDILGLNSYWYQKYYFDNHTIYDQVKQIRPGHFAIYDLEDKKLKEQRYYNLESEISKQESLTIPERIERINELLPKVVEDRMVADVAVGTFLSGGLDSSVISALASKTKEDLHTFSVGFKQKSFDESMYSNLVSKHLQTTHHHQFVELSDELIESVVSHLDQPFGDSSILPTAALSKATKKHVTVALSGDGADEIFGGYDTYKAYLLGQLLPSMLMNRLKPCTSLIPASQEKVSRMFLLKRFIERYNHDPQKRHLENMATFPFRTRTRMMLQAVSQVNFMYERPEISNQLRDIQLLDMYNYLPGDILMKTDIASTFASLEVRVPYLDHRIVPLVLSLPDKHKMTLYESKKVLRLFAEKLVPNDIITRKKRGFSVPIATWLKESELLKEYILSDTYYGHILVSRGAITKLWDKHQNGEADYSRELWLVFVFNYWWWNQGKRMILI